MITVLDTIHGMVRLHNAHMYDVSGRAIGICDFKTLRKAMAYTKAISGIQMGSDGGCTEIIVRTDHIIQAHLEEE